MKTMDQNKVFTDTPVRECTQDKFQRYEFSKRIANTIIENPQKDAIVIGIYGAWGEGKTSVINFIKNELGKQEAISIINFNPWHYNDEKTLLSNFFTILASVLDTQLQTGKEKIGEWIKKYGEKLNFDIPVIGGNLGDIAKSAGSLISDVDIDEVKKRIEKIIIDRGKKIIIFIDDIDRLDKNEIYSVFRLVKLTADFVNTTYVLSFDEKMVAAAIGNRFGSGDEKAGRDFLEKIVQVPLCIPKASSESLRVYCIELIVKIIEVHNIIISEEDTKNFGYQFTTNIANSLNTPRMAVRYANSLSFALPLLYNEVNIADLMLIEAVKIFYPKHYNFIKNNPDYFISNYKNIIGDSDNEKKEQIKKVIEDLGKDYSKQQQKCILDLLQNLFPHLKEAYNDWSNSNMFLNLYKNKNIGSEKYFDRYFSYVVLKGDLSDIEFNNFINKIANYDNQQVSDSIKLLIRDNAVANFILKIRAIEDEITWEKATKLLQALPSLGELFPDTYEPITMGINSPKTQLSIFICNILKSQKDRTQRFLTGKEILSKADTLRFANEIIRWADVGRWDDEKTFNEKELLLLKGALIERLISENGDQPIYSAEYGLYHTFNDWNQYDPKGMTKYIRDYIRKTPSDIFLLLRSVMSKDLLSNIVLDIDKEKFDFIDNVFDKDFIRKSILKVFSMKMLKADKTIWIEHTGEKLNDIDIARQFMHWYNVDKKAKLQSIEIQV